MFSQTLDEIYEAALVPSKWLAVLHDLARSIDAEGTLLFSARDGASRSIVSKGIVELVRSFNDEGWDQRNTRAARLLANAGSSFVSDFDLFTETEMLQQPMYSQFLRPKGFGWGAATALQTANDNTLVFSIEKRLDRGPVNGSAISYLNRLRPHLARSAFLASRLEFERLNAAIDAMQISGLASAALTGNGNVIVCNKSFEDLAPQLNIGAFNRLSFAAKMANDRLSLSLASITAKRPSIGASAASFTLPQHGGHSPAVVHMVPIRGDARDIFARAAFFIIITPIDRQRVPSSQIIQELFDLSPAESRVASLLAAGKDVRATAAALKLSPDTVRSHVKGILNKSGMSRQTDFVAAIAGLRDVAR
ncbi:MAG: helix-turn-helix transcriptional regulator [Rhizobium sp.]|nr:helix-turn-helix transcriptional regulator [Rhizobium sp.]